MFSSTELEHATKAQLMAIIDSLLNLLKEETEFMEIVYDGAAAAMGSKGGNTRKEKLSAERRSEIARKAANKRWGNTNGSS